MIDIFPMIQPEAIATDDEMPLYREVKWNYEKNTPIWENGNPIFVEGKEAVAVWIYKALSTPRFRYEIYSWNFGCETESLIGQDCTE